MRSGRAYYSRDFPIWNTCATALPSNAHCLPISNLVFLSFLYQFQLAIDFVTGLLREECFFSAFFFTIFWGLYKKKRSWYRMRILHIVHDNAENKLAFIETACFCCFFFRRLSLSPRASFFFSSIHFSLLSIVDISLLHTFNQLPERHLFTFIVAEPVVQKATEEKQEYKEEEEEREKTFKF